MVKAPDPYARRAVSRYGGSSGYYIYVDSLSDPHTSTLAGGVASQLGNDPQIAEAELLKRVGDPFQLSDTSYGPPKGRVEAVHENAEFADGSSGTTVDLWPLQVEREACGSAARVRITALGYHYE